VPLLKFPAATLVSGEAASDVAGDPRPVKMRQALELLHDGKGSRAERIQRIFSLDYDPKWQTPKPK
jgi:hypothetical protein